ncbi:Sorcin [Smittium mucronatum]|uniref:Sorcin n=1 Tax=Smittium mucronatum TaxID=133383 RepID=A0A1R0GU28_9FUNG|nr:Sorcin [Smittium mucronatum]
MPFSIETVRLMIQMFDRDMSGTIDFNEFKALVKYLNEWQTLFRTFDNDGSGSISNAELFNALHAFGLPVSPRVVDLVVSKVRILEGVKRTRGPTFGISFDRFIYACVMVKNFSDVFKKVDTDGDGWINLDYDTFMSISITNK